MTPEGAYWASVKRVGMAETENKGTEYVFLEIDVTHSSNGSEWIELPNHITRTIQVWVSDSAFERSRGELELLGFNGDFGNPAIDPEKAAGFVVICTHDDYNGRVWEKWSIQGAASSGWKKKPISAEKVMRLNAMWQAENDGAAPARPTPPAPTGGPPAAASNTSSGPGPF